jgi:cytochrome b
MRAGTLRILVWDVPTRVFHWLLALFFAVAFVTADSERWRDIHVLAGYTFAGLIAFRIVWGLVGTRYARVHSFLFRPGEVGRYLLTLASLRPRHFVGHNPAGSIAIWLVLGLGVLAGASGYAAYNSELHWVGELHEGIANGLLAVVVVHVAGVAVSSLLHRENLVRAMITGCKRGERGDGIRRAHAWLGILIAAAVIGFWYQGLRDAPPAAPQIARLHHDRHGGDRAQ